MKVKTSNTIGGKIDVTISKAKNIGAEKRLSEIIIYQDYYFMKDSML